MASYFLIRQYPGILSQDILTLFNIGISYPGTPGILSRIVSGNTAYTIEMIEATVNFFREQDGKPPPSEALVAQIRQAAKDKARTSANCRKYTIGKGPI